MSFKDLEEIDLRKLAVEDFGVEVPEGAGPEEICAALVESGVTWDMAVQQSPVAAEIEKNKVEANAVERSRPKHQPIRQTLEDNVDDTEPEPDALLRMMRENSRYDVRGYTFTKKNPFCIVDPTNAEWIVEHIDGFRYATPKEVREFYG